MNDKPRIVAGGSVAWTGLCAVLLALFVWNSLYYSPWTVDDAYISLRYAQNLLDGEGLVYNPGKRVEGFSNFSWVILAASIMRLGLPIVASLKVVGLLCGVATIVIAARLVRRLVSPEHRTLAGTLTVAFLSLNASLALWCQSGLETTFFAVLIVSMCLRFEYEQGSERALPWSALLYGLAWMTRPEAPVYALYFLIRRWSWPPRLRARDWRWLVVLCLLVVPYEIWGWSYYGALVGQTAKAKSVGWFWTSQPLMHAYFLEQGWGFPVLVALGLLGAVLRIGALPPPLWCPTVGGLVFVLYAHRDWMPRHRFFVPSLAIQGALIAFGLAALIGWTGRWRWLRYGVVLLVCAAGVDYGRTQLTGAYTAGRPDPVATRERPWTWWQQVPAHLGRRDWPQESKAWVILAHTSGSERVVMRDIGFPGFVTMNPVWDMAGLVTPAALEFRHGPNDEATRARVVRQYLDSGGAGHLFFPASPDPRNRNAPQRFEHLLVSRAGLAARCSPVVREPKADLIDAIVAGRPSGFRGPVWACGDDVTAGPGGRLDTLERRLPDLLRRFPEYGSRARAVVDAVRRRAERASTD